VSANHVLNVISSNFFFAKRLAGMVKVLGVSSMLTGKA
jgi:hypothetical protein